MDIKIVSRVEIDLFEWNRCVSNAKNRLPYAFSWYLDHMAGNWYGLIINEYDAVMPLPVRRKYGISYTYTPFFVQQLGLFSSKRELLLIDNDIIKQLNKLFRYIDYNINELNTIEIPDNYQIIQNKNLKLNIDKTYDQIRKSYSKNHLRNIKQAEKNQLEIDETKQIRNSISLYLQNHLHQYKHIREKDIERLASLMEYTLKDDKGKLYEVRHNNKILCAGFFLFDADNIIFLFSANSDKGKDLRAMFYLMDYVIKKYAGKFNLLDFDGSNNENVSRFYQGFGAKQTTYLTMQGNNLPFFARWIKK